MARRKRNYTQRAIELAIAGGWEPKYLPADFYQEKNLKKWKHYAINHPDPVVFFHDPEFFRGLQKRLSAQEPKHEWTKKTKGMQGETTILDWVSNTMHSMWDHFLEGKELEQFFEELLTHHKAKL